MNARTTFVALALVLVTPSPAAAQCRLCDEPTTGRPTDEITGDVQLQVESNLDFDRLVLAGPGNGAMVIRADGSVAREGSVTGTSPRAMVGMVSVHGEPGRAVRIEIPRQVLLYALGGGRLVVNDIESDAPAMPRLDAAGNLTFRFGGRLVLTGDADGPYRGDLPITVEYVAERTDTIAALTGH